MSIRALVAAMASLLLGAAAGDAPARSFSALASGIGRPSAVAVDGQGNTYVAAPDLSRVFKIDGAGRLTVAAGGKVRTGPDAQNLPNGDDGPSALSSLTAPAALAVDGLGNVYIADDGDRAVRRIDGRTGIITTMIGGPRPPPPWWPGRAAPPAMASPMAAQGKANAAGLIRPGGLAVDAAGHLYVADRGTHSVFRMTVADGSIEKIAGSGLPGYVGDGGPAVQARLSSPEGLAIDGAGVLYVADRGNHCVRRIDGRTGTIRTVAGDGFAGDSGDGGRASAARLRDPVAVAVDGRGDLFIADLGNARVRRIAKATSLISTASGLEHAACGAIAATKDGTLFVAEAARELVLRRDAAGVVTPVAGNGGVGYTGDGGAATAAFLQRPAALARDAHGNLYVADSAANRVRRIDVTTGQISTVAGNGRRGFAGDGAPAATAILAGPEGLAFDRDGQLVIADTLNHRLRRVALDGTMTTIAGNGDAGFPKDGGRALDSALGSPTTVMRDAAGDLLVVQGSFGMIHRIDTAGVLHTIVGSSGQPPLLDGAPATSGRVARITAGALGRGGEVVFAEEGSLRIWSVDPAAGIAKIIAGRGLGAPEGAPDQARAAAFGAVHALASDGAGNLYVGEIPAGIRRIDVTTQRVVTVLSRASLPTLPAGLVWASPDTLYLADSAGYVRRVLPDGASAVVAGGGAGF